MNIAYAVAGLTLLGMVCSSHSEQSQTALQCWNPMHQRWPAKMSLVVLLEILNSLTSPMRMPSRKWVNCWAKMTIQTTKRVFNGQFDVRPVTCQEYVEPRAFLAINATP